ncbi:MAG TPA: hypothetical protein VGX23_26810 [Actinocrinis sp.]|nr:hypothetical protein [Actinocrinis sp.]
MSPTLPDGGIELSAAEIEALDARWASSWAPRAVARKLSGIETPWYVAAGWALDLFRGEQTRRHGAVPHLTTARRQTLAELLARVHPGHPWLADL